MTLKAVFIDVGNTLLYEKPSRFEIYAQGARRRGLVLTAQEMHQLMRRAHQELPREIGGAFRYTDGWFAAYIQRIFHEYLGLSRSELSSLKEELFGRFAQPETFALYPGSVELLDGLRERSLCIGLVSNWSARLPRLLEDLDLASRVDFVMCSAIERLEKPDPAMFERALARAGVGADEALHAGDDLEKDLAGARRVGMRAVLVDHDGKWTGEAPRVRDLFELKTLIERLV